MSYAFLIGTLLPALALAVWVGRQLLRQVTRACMPHPLQSDEDAFLNSCQGGEEAEVSTLDARTQNVEAQDGLLAGLGILLGTALGLWHYPAWLAVSLACGAYLVLTGFKKAPQDLKVTSKQQAARSRQ